MRSAFATILQFAILVSASRPIATPPDTAPPVVPVTIGRSAVALNGPWKFHTGDDPRWSDPALDDSDWDTMDLTAPAGATDGDVGLPNYASGWNAHGYAGYRGFAWYRIHLDVTAAPDDTLALLGPWAVESGYQLFANGRLLGGVGDLSGATPVAHSYHYPRYFPLPPGMLTGGPMVIAVRVWAGPWVIGPAAGGIHIAPAIGERDAVAARYRLQWLKIFEGYAVDAVPALLFVLTAVMALCLIPLDPRNRAYPWLAAALLLSAVQRGNQAFFFWLEIETVRQFVYVIIVLVGSLNFAAWIMAWRAWFAVDRPAWLPPGVALLALILMGAQVLGEPWLFVAAYPRWPVTVAHGLTTTVHLAFALLLGLVVSAGIRRRGRDGWYALPAVLASGAVLFPAELTAVHVPGIWFPWGVGLSLGECASVAVDVFLFGLLVRRLRSYAARAGGGVVVTPAR